MNSSANVVIVPRRVEQLIAEKLADYVSRAGTAFEVRVEAAVRRDDRFAFLYNDGLGRAYYEAMLRHRGVIPAAPFPPPPPLPAKVEDALTLCSD